MARLKNVDELIRKDLIEGSEKIPVSGDEFVDIEQIKDYALSDPGVVLESLGLSETDLENIKSRKTQEEMDLLLDSKVDKEEGKGLSTNDFTDELKTFTEELLVYDPVKKDKLLDTKIDELRLDFEELPSLNVEGLIGLHNISNSSHQDIRDSIPTQISQLGNDSGYITALVSNLLNYYTRTEIDNLLNGLSKLSFKKVDTLPGTGDSNVIYLLPNGSVFDEYIWFEDKWEMIGTTDVDLSDYYTKTEIDTYLSEKVDKIEGLGLTNIITEEVGTGTDISLEFATKTYVDSGLSDKVDKVFGKGLSTNDFTNSDRTKLMSVETGSQPNIIEGAVVGVTPVEIVNKILQLPENSGGEGNIVEGAVIGTVPVGIINKVLQFPVYPDTSNKVDKVAGKELSTNDYTDLEKTKLSGIETSAEVNIVEGAVIGSIPVVIDGKTLQLPEYPEPVDISGKVDKVAGKELSTNDYTDLEKIKLEGIEDGAEINIIESATIGSIPVTITGKTLQLPEYPDISGKVDKVAGKELSTNDYTDLEKTKLSGIEEEAEVNIIDGAVIGSTEVIIVNKKLQLPETIITGKEVVEVSHTELMNLITTKTLDVRVIYKLLNYQSIYQASISTTKGWIGNSTLTGEDNNTHPSDYYDLLLTAIDNETLSPHGKVDAVRDFTTGEEPEYAHDRVYWEIEYSPYNKGTAPYMTETGIITRIYQPYLKWDFHYDVFNYKWWRDSNQRTTMYSNYDLTVTEGAYYWTFSVASSTDPGVIKRNNFNKAAVSQVLFKGCATGRYGGANITRTDSNIETLKDPVGLYNAGTTVNLTGGNEQAFYNGGGNVICMLTETGDIVKDTPGSGIGQLTFIAIEEQAYDNTFVYENALNDTDIGPLCRKHIVVSKGSISRLKFEKHCGIGSITVASDYINCYVVKEWSSYFDLRCSIVANGSVKSVISDKTTFIKCNYFSSSAIEVRGDFNNITLTGNLLYSNCIFIDTTINSGSFSYVTGEFTTCTLNCEQTISSCDLYLSACNITTPIFAANTGRAYRLNINCSTQFVRTNLFQNIDGDVVTNITADSITSCILENAPEINDAALILENTKLSSLSEPVTNFAASQATSGIILQNNQSYTVTGSITSMIIIAATGESDIVFTAGSGLVITLPATHSWNGGEVPVFEENKEYTLIVFRNIVYINKGV